MLFRSVIGLNLTYYYGLTEDESVGQLLSRTLNISSSDLPKREIVPYHVEYMEDRIVLSSERADLNTGIAYHDSFKASGEIYQRNHLLHVGEGATVIFLTYPYLKWGMALSALAAALILWHTLYRKRRAEKAAKQTE